MERIFVIALQLLYFYNVNKKGWIFGIGLIRKRKTAKGAGLLLLYKTLIICPCADYAAFGTIELFFEWIVSFFYGDFSYFCKHYCTKLKPNLKNYGS